MVINPNLLTAPGANAFSSLANRGMPPMRSPIPQQPIPVQQPMPVGPVARPFGPPDGVQNPIQVNGPYQVQAPGNFAPVNGEPMRPGMATPLPPQTANAYAALSNLRRPQMI